MAVTCAQSVNCSSLEWVGAVHGWMDVFHVLVNTMDAGAVDPSIYQSRLAISISGTENTPQPSGVVQVLEAPSRHRDMRSAIIKTPMAGHGSNIIQTDTPCQILDEVIQ